MEELKLYNSDFLLQYEKFYKFFDTINEDYDILEVIPDYLKEDYIEQYESNLNSILEKDTKCYIDLFKMQEKFLKNLQPSKIDGLAYLAIKEIEKNETISSILNTFKPFKGFTNKIKYNRFGTVTGRLTVKAGPNILILPKRCRKILKSRWDSEGEVLSIDFISLEPRLARKLTSTDTGLDVYQDIMDSISFEIDRSVIKKVIISVLYGSERSFIEGFSRERSQEVFNAVHEYFNIGEIKQRYIKQDEFCILRNFFGRPLWIDMDQRENVLVNNFIQSSAVDLSLKYFAQLTEKLDPEYFKPLYVIHDALVVDVKKEYKQKVEDLINLGYNDKELGNFPLNIEQV